jgi:hypothetical protein
MHLIRTGIVFGAGYVLGAKAGRERFEQIVATATLVSERPEVRKVTDPVLAFFTTEPGQHVSTTSAPNVPTTAG